MTTTIVCDIPQQLKSGEWKLTSLFKSGRSTTRRYANYTLAFNAYLKASRDKRQYAAELYLSCVTDLAGELIFRACECQA